MSFRQKYLKYKYKYLYLKNQSAGSDVNTCHIYNGGSFSPPTLAHQEVCIETIKFLMEYFVSNTINSNVINKIVLHIVPVSDIYPKASVKNECIPYIIRRAMLQIMIQNILDHIIVHTNTFRKKYVIQIDVNNIEYEVSSVDGFIGTYRYIDKFSNKFNISPSNIFLLYGLDNVKNLVSGGINRWQNSIHLVSKFKFLTYPRSGQTINYSELISKFKENIDEFNSSQKELNISNGLNDLNDILDKICEFKSNPEMFMRERFIEVIASQSTDKNDIVSMAEASSSNIRKVLYNYSDFTVSEDLKTEIFKTIDSRILRIAMDYYKNGLMCEKEEDFEKIKTSMSKK
jgi:nicotinic acid mononucleotide adenylyltransferase